MKIERDKTYLTRDGRKARVVCVDAAGSFPVVAVVENGAEETPDAFTADGAFYSAEDEGLSRHDLVSEYVEPPKPRECWVYVAGDHLGAAYTHEQRNASLLDNPEHAANLVLFREVLP